MREQLEFCQVNWCSFNCTSESSRRKDIGVKEEKPGFGRDVNIFTKDG